MKRKKIIFPLFAFFLLSICFADSSLLFAKTQRTEQKDSPIVALSASTYNKETAKGLVFVDFWTPWCAPCRKMNPILEELAKEYEGTLKIAKLNTDENLQFTKNKKIQSIPAIIVYKDGKEVTRIIGLASKKELIEVVDKYK